MPRLLPPRARLVAAVVVALGGGAASRPAPAQPPINTRAILADLDRYIPKALADWNGAGVAVGIVKDDSLIYA